MNPAWQMSMQQGTADRLRYVDLRSGMSFRDPVNGSTWLVVHTDGVERLGPVDRVEVTYLVTNPSGETNTRRIRGWSGATAWLFSDRIDGG